MQDEAARAAGPKSALLVLFIGSPDTIARRALDVSAETSEVLVTSLVQFPGPAQGVHRDHLCGVRQETRIRSGLATMMAMALAREVATFRRCTS